MRQTQAIWTLILVLGTGGTLACGADDGTDDPASGGLGASGAPGSGGSSGDAGAPASVTGGSGGGDPGSGGGGTPTTGGSGGTPTTGGSAGAAAGGTGGDPGPGGAGGSPGDVGAGGTTVSCEGVDHCADTTRGEWALLVIPDTQHHSEDRATAPLQYMVDAFDWIVAIKDQLNIRMVQGLGDITESGGDTWQWDNAMVAWDKLRDQVPHVPNQGNHDDIWTMNQRFDLGWFQAQPWWGGDFEGIHNSYQLMTIGNEEYLFANIQSHDPWGTDNPGARDWLNGVITDHADRKVILATHDTWETTTIRDTILTAHDNIVMSNAGHTCAREQMFVTNGPGGGTSYNFITDYQCDGNEVMLLRYYIFKPLEDQVTYFTYSPITDAFEADGDSQGSFALEQADP